MLKMARERHEIALEEILKKLCSLHRVSVWPALVLNTRHHARTRTLFNQLKNFIVHRSPGGL